MTWKEFKKWVDDQNIPEDVKIWYIDISFPDDPDLLCLSLDEQLGLSIN